MGAPDADEPVDLLSEWLNALRPGVRVVHRRELSAPWTLEVDGSSHIAGTCCPQANPSAVLHVVCGGHCWVRLDDADPVHLRQGDVVVLPYGHRHVLSSEAAPGSSPGRRSAAPIPVPEELPDAWTQVGGGPTELVSGYLSCDQILLQPLLRVLPALLHVPASIHTEPSHPGWSPDRMTTALGCQLAGAAQEASPGSGCLRARLAELLFMAVLRWYVGTLPSGTANWMQALNDRTVGRALQLLHAHPAERWTVTCLARQVGMSRSRLGSSFKATLGQPPMQYLAGWRMQIAAGLLREGKPGVAAVAARVGYDSEHAFNRAFKRFSGVPPARWRAAVQEGTRPAGPG